MPHGSISGDSLGLSARAVAFTARQSSRWQAALGDAVKAASNFLTREASVDATFGRLGAAGRAPIESLEARQLLSATYFVSPSGSDSGPGTLGAPFRTIQHAASIASSGSVVNIEAGTYHETVTPAQSGVTFQAYKGESVEIDGADPVSGFSKYSGSIYKASAGGSLGFGNNQVFVNNQMVTEDRWPYSNNLSHPTMAHASSGTGNSITDPGLPSGLVGCTIHIAVGQEWVAQTATITGQSGDRIFFNLGGSVAKAGSPEGGNPFYITGKLSLLSSPGEWYEDPSGNLYLRAPNSGAPAGVEVKHRQYGFDLNGKSNIVINGINLFACSITAQHSSGIKINGIHDTYVSQFLIAPDGWHVPESSGINITGNDNSISNSVIADSAGDGVFMTGNGNSVSNCVIHDFAYQGFDNAAIRISGSGDTISSNTIYNGGRDGVKCSGATSIQVVHNLIHDVMLQTTDGGGIYSFGTNGSGSVWAYNKIYNVSAGGWGAGGLYLDNNDHGYYVHNNDVFSCEIAFKINPSSLDEKIISNTLLGSEFSIEGSGSKNMSGSELIDNVFNKPIQVSGSVVISGNVHSGNTSDISVAGASISG